ncbi:MAG: cysteine desulfurase [Methanotrichaceae archaeon]|nr:cysteine desulfurase [Methanotrichaceae archaeon]
MNVSRLREDFAVLSDVIYLDSAATSLTPEPVLKSVEDYYRHFRANVGRGVYRQAQLADQRYRLAHNKLAEFVAASGGTTVFTRNATESINLVAQGLSWKRGDRVVTTLLEHHSNLLPWMKLKSQGVELEIIKPDREGRIDTAEFERAINDDVRLVATTHVSNVLGTVLPVREISDLCRENGAMYLLDAAQSAPHLPLKVDILGCDFLCFSGHKMLGPTGTGVLWMKDESPVQPLLSGGGMVDQVFEESFSIKKGYEGFEAGTPDVGGGIGLGAAADYLQKVGLAEVHNHEMMLTQRLLMGLQEIEGLEIYGPADLRDRSGVVSFNIRGLLPHEVALMLDQAKSIAVRSGHHCCMPLMRHLGLDHGTVRASVYLYNTEEEIDLLLQTLESIARLA